MSDVEGESEPHHIELTRAMSLWSTPDLDARTLAIISASYVENYLTALIESRLPGLNTDLRQKLFGPDGSARDMAMKLDLAKALDVLTARGYNSGKAIARIRNRFAHSIAIDSFDHPEVAKILDKTDSIRGFSLGKEGYEIDRPDGRRETFLYLAKEMCFDISSEIDKIKGIEGWSVGDTKQTLAPPPKRTWPVRSLRAPESMVKSPGLIFHLQHD